MEHAYTIIFWVGVIYSVVTFLIGGLFDIIHIGGDVGAHMNSHLQGHTSSAGFKFFPLKPITIVSFITVFGGIGIMGTYYRFNEILTFIFAVLLAFIVPFMLYKFVVEPLYKAQNTSAVYKKELIGIKAMVISKIIENGFGTISYVVNGSKYNAPAQHISKKTVLQGEEVIIYKIEDNIFYVEPL